MNEAINIFPKCSKEYERLQAAASLIMAETGKATKVDTVLFDASQNWPWTTITMESGLSSFPFMQILNPKQQKSIVHETLDEWMETVTTLIKKHS